MSAPTMATPESAFIQAVKDFLGRPSKKKPPLFIQRCLSGDFSTTAEEIQIELLKLDQSSCQQTGRRVVRGVFEALSDYDAVIGVLVQIDPMPSALVWGGLKAILECFNRHKTVLERVESHLKRLTQELKRLREYEELFTESQIMQDLLVEQYKQILQFWTVAEKTYSSSALTLAAKSLTSASTRRLSEILDGITQSGNDIAKTVPIVQERLRRGDKEDVFREYKKIEFMLSNLFNLQSEKQKESRIFQVESWLRGKEHSSDDNNHRHQRSGEEVLLPGSGDWLTKHPRFTSWVDSSSKTNTIWIHGDPGVGKSVMCARAVKEIRETDPSAVIAFQYFSFDEQTDSPTATYRKVASQLFSELAQSDDVSDYLVDLTRSLDDEGALQAFIESTIMESKKTYIFIDGLDEECAGKRWVITRRVLRFLKHLSQRSDTPLRLWISSQDRPVIREELANVPEIHIDETTNGQDMEALFKNSLAAGRLPKTLSATEKATSLLQDLQSQVHGNFLWASMMIETIQTAYSLKDLRERINTGLPEDFELYLKNHVQGLKKSSLVVKALSFLTYAKRPLSIEELCEAIEVSNTKFGRDLDDEGFIARESIVEYCSPLVRITKMAAESSKQEVEVCTLCHGSIQQFLMKNPKLFVSDDTKGSEDMEITSTLIAETCLQYLQQPRYAHQLRQTENGNLATESGQDILDHHLLIYSARYWNSHINDVSFTPDLGVRIEKFVRSNFFITCLQVQALFIRGRFAFNWSSKVLKPSDLTMYSGLPIQFIEEYPSGKLLGHQYGVAMDEWGVFLNGWASVISAFAGQLDQCLWAGLGKSNFLHRIPSSIKCYPLETVADTSNDGHVILYSHMQPGLGEYLVFKTDVRCARGSLLLVDCERWVRRKFHQPRFESTQTFSVPSAEFEFYSVPTVMDPSLRPAFVAMSDCGTLLRIGSQVFYRSSAGCNFHQLKIEDVVGYTDQISCGPGFIAVSSRRRILTQVVEDETRVPTDNQSSNLGHEDGSCRNTPTSSDDSDRTIVDTNDATSTFTSDSSEGDTDSDVESNFEFDTSEIDQFILGMPPEIELDSDIGSNSVSSISCSARESWSDASSQALSDEIDDDITWNDWDRVADFMDFEDEVELETGTEVTKDSTGQGCNHGEHDESAEGAEGETLLGKKKELEKRLGLAENKSLKGRVCEIRIFPITNGVSQKHAFRFVQKSRGILLESPPVFHPTLPLVVWPTGGQEILFVNYGDRTYFTRIISGPEPDECLISVQSKFSSCGKYLHLASFSMALGPMDPHKSIPEKDGKPLQPIQSFIRVTTYRLSEQKSARSPPRLVYRNVLDLDNCNEVKKDVKGPWPMFTLTWTDDYVYVANNKWQLQIYRIPLFQYIEEKDSGIGTLHGIAENDGNVYLPQSVKDRRVFFYPTSNHGTRNAFATVVLSSEITEGPIGLRSLQTVAEKEAGPPQVIYLTPSQLGDFNSSDYCKHGTKHPKRTSYFKGGQLLSKFEDFLTCAICGKKLIYVGTTESD